MLLTLGATWCHWCHVMDQTSYSDEQVIELVNSRFIPVRVDVDQRPDISLRYNQGGFPSVAFLTGDGEFLTGRPTLPRTKWLPYCNRFPAVNLVLNINPPGVQCIVRARRNQRLCGRSAGPAD